MFNGLKKLKSVKGALTGLLLIVVILGVLAAIVFGACLISLSSLSDI